MSVVTALGFVLIAGFVGTGLVGFLGWRQRMRDRTGADVDRIMLTPTNRAQRPFACEIRPNVGEEGARS